MIHIAPGPDTAHAEVTFTIPADGLEDVTVAVVGDFNDWNPAAHPMARWGLNYQCTLTLEVGHRHTVKYIAAGRTWFNDDTVTDYEPNAYGGVDAILDLTPTQLARTRRPPLAWAAPVPL